MSTSITRPLAGLIAALLLAPVVVTAQIRPIERSSAGRLKVAYVPPVGPAPPSTGWDYSGTFGVIAKVVWGPAPNAVSYTVKRRLQEDASCCNATSGILPATATSWTDTGLYKKGIYAFTILVNYADGSVGSGEVYITAPGVQNPVLTATNLAPGRVRLTFNNVISGTSGFLVGGPGLGSGKTVSSGPVDTGLLTPGTYTWTIASIYSQNLGILSPAADWGKVTHTVAYGTGRYRISLERFKAIATTAEDPFRTDGRGDEVFITTQVNEYGANGALVSSRMARTPTFGDVYNYPARIRAGSMQPTGGILPNDEYPAAVQYISQLQPATLTNLPYLLWEGNLTEISGVVILSPAIWETDEDDRLFPFYATFQLGAAANLPFRQPFQAYVPWTLGAGGVIDTWNPQRSCPTPLGGGAPTLFVPPSSGWRDEPMDVNQDHSYCPTYVAINWRLANSQTTVNPASVVEIPFTSTWTNWQYKLYVRIEKVN